MEWLTSGLSDPQPEGSIAGSGVSLGPSWRTAVARAFPVWRPATLRWSASAVLVGTRLPVLLLGVLAVTAVGTVPAPTAEALWRISSSELANLQARWDTAFYDQIATTGYHWDPSTFLHQNVVFFPLYPLLMRWGGALLGGHPLLAGTFISLAAFMGAISLLYRLAVIELGEEQAWPVILLLSTYPYALFYSVVYTESLFLFLTVGAFYAANVEQYLFQDPNNWRKYYENVATLPLDSASTFIRSVGGGFGFSGGGGMRLGSVLCPIQELLAAYRAGRIQSYSDVIAMSR